MTYLSRRMGLALALAVLAPARAQAVMINGYVGGEITDTFPDERVYNFALGELVAIDYTFETRNVPNPGGSGGGTDRYEVVPATFQLRTSGGYTGSGRSFQNSGGDLLVVNGAMDSLRFVIGLPGLSIELTLIDPTGEALFSTALPTQEQLILFTQGDVYFNRDRPLANESFRASVRSFSSPVTVSLPEPSTFALGGIGLGILGLGCTRRRRGRAAA